MTLLRRRGQVLLLDRWTDAQGRHRHARPEPLHAEAL